MSDPSFKKYIGDSVYADFDGNGIVLTTENGLPTDPSNTIVLEPETLEGLKLYETWLKDKIKELTNAQPK